jgi:ATP-dependent helicase/nuclease subunit B
MYERIAAAMGERRVFLIVPEQSTLRAESDAFDYMGVSGFIDFDVLSMTSLGRRIIGETGYGEIAGGAASGDADGATEGGGAAGDDGDSAAGSATAPRAAAPAFISKYGKYMLLSRLLYHHRNDMLAFKNLGASSGFIEQLNDMIAEMKSHNVTPDGLGDIIAEMKSESILKRKLQDAALIYGGYEDAICGRYLDVTDHMKLYTSRMGSASFIPDSEFWFHGFDYFSPAVMDAITELSRHARAVNIFLTGDAAGKSHDPLFALTSDIARELSRRADDTGVRTALLAIPETEAAGYRVQTPAEIAHIERALFTRPHTPYDGEPTGALRLTAAANYYAEAETAASEICSLVREGIALLDGGRMKIRYRDILVLCNDMAERGAVIKRVFRRYGLPVFMDQRRGVDHNPVVEFILALPRIAASGRRYEEVFTLLKTGLAGIDPAEVCDLENYTVAYNVRGRRWDRDFTLGLKTEGEDGRVRGEYEQEEMDALNSARAKVSALLTAFEEGFKGGGTARERTDALLLFLTEQAKLPERIEEYIARLEAADMFEYAAEMSGIWDMAAEILEQMATVLGGLPMSLDEYATVLAAGLDSIRIGVLPTVMDQIVLGTMQRTRSGGAKAVFVLGANDGVLPAAARDGSILSEDEIYRLSNAGHNVARTEDTTHMEEELAIYRNLSKPSALLRVSYAASDSAGKTISPSPVFERLRRLFPLLPVRRDIHMEGNSEETSERSADESANEHDARDGQDGQDRPENIPVPPTVQHPEQTLDHLSEQLRSHIHGELMPDVWKDVMAWYSANMPRELARVGAGLAFRGRRERVDSKFVDALFSKVTSPSALEKYSRCPFSWFMSYGIGLKERRVHGADSRSFGDIYHNVLMRFGMELSSDGLPARDEKSKWQTATDAEIDNIISRLARDEYANLMGAEYDSEAEAAMGDYRHGRVERTVSAAARALARQIRDGRLDSIHFESGFGNHGEFPAIYTSGGIRIEGRIDRVDVMDGGYARIVDYKSGAQEFSEADAAAGYQLQLMIYLQAVSENYIPAGVFYFRIKEPRIEDSGETDIAAEIAKNMKLAGASVNDEFALTAMGIDPKGRSTKGRMDKAEWDALRETVGDMLKNLTENLSAGHVEAAPKTATKLKTPANRNQKACDYCRYKGICNYDPTF